MGSPVLTRPIKSGNVRTFTQQVTTLAPNDAPILAAEVDGDVDLLVNAWNSPSSAFPPMGPAGGDLAGSAFPNPLLKNDAVTTAKLADGAVTGPKLAPGAQPWTVVAGQAALAPVDRANIALEVGSAMGLRSRMMAFPDDAELSINWRIDGSVDDLSRPSWALDLAARSGVADSTISASYRAPGAAAGVFTSAFWATGAGDFFVIRNLQSAKVLVIGPEPTVEVGAGPAPRGRVVEYDEQIQLTRNWRFDGGVDDVNQASWAFFLGLDRAGVFYRAPGAGTQTFISPLSVAPVGDLIIAGSNATKASGTLWINPSDPKLKTDVAPYRAGLAELCRLDPVTYRLKAQPQGPTCYGFDAEAVRAVLPECVGTMKLDGEDVLTLDMHPMLIAMVGALKELAGRVTAVEEAVL